MEPEKTVYLHIGQDKAGSSAIQRFLRKNYQRLNQSGYDLAGGLCQHHGKLHASIVNGDRGKLDSDCRYIRDSEQQNFIISFEGIYALRDANLECLLDSLRDFRVVAVFYVRRRSDKFRSGFAQNLKLGGRYDMREAWLLVNDKIDIMHPEVKYTMDYLAIVRNWQECLARTGPRNEIRLRVYEKSSFFGGDLLADFCRTIDLIGEGETLESASLKRPKKVSNPSLSPAAQYLNVFAQVMRPTQEQSEALLELLAACDNGDARRLSLVPDSVARKLDRQYRSDDKVLAREFLGRSRLFTEPARFRYGRPDGESFAELIRAVGNKAELFEQ